MAASDWPVQVDPVYGCWIWTGSLDDRGYAWVWTGYRQRAWAHRHVWETERGPIPAGKELDHLCRRRACVRPEHAEPVTQRENKRRMHWRQRALQETCPSGHGYYLNGRRTPEGGIICLTCCGLKP